MLDSSATISSGFPHRLASLSMFSPSFVRASVTGRPPACLVPALISNPSEIFNQVFLAYTPKKQGYNASQTVHPRGFEPLTFGSVDRCSIECGFHAVLSMSVDKESASCFNNRPRGTDCKLSRCTDAGLLKNLNNEMSSMRFFKKRVLLMDWLNRYANERSLRYESKRQFEISVELFLQFVGKKFFVDQFSEHTLSEFIRDYRRSVSATTARNKRTALLALWRSASDAGLCSPPTRRVQGIKVSHQAIQAWRVDQVRDLIHECRQLKRKHPCGLPRSLWWELAVRVAWDSGLRWGDQIQLQVSQVDSAGVGSIVQSKTNRVVVFRLSESTLGLMHKTLSIAPRKLITPWPCSHETFNAQFRLIVRKSSVQCGTWKWLRRGSATDVERNHPGCGSTHLGHVPGSPIAERNYFDQTILKREKATPTDL